MANAAAESLVRRLFAAADIHINQSSGSRPWDIQVSHPDFYARLLRDASIGLGEAYMDGWWDVPALDQFIAKVLRGRLKEQVKGNWRLQWHTLKAVLFNLQTSARAFQVAEAHYDLGNDLYKAMLDPRMVYTCGYWKNARNLAEAQEHKLDLVCRKAGLQKGMKVLDLGCGWGGLAAWAAEKYQVEVVGISVSKEQVALAREMWKGLPVEFRLGDYRDIDGQYDAVLSVGMAEHIGHKNYRTMMQVIHRSLRDEGVAVVHTIGNNSSKAIGVPFIEKYIFPNGVAPSMSQLARATEGLFVLEDVQNIGPDYDPTLMAWWANFDAAWPQLRGPRYDDRFYRMWKFYLLAAAGASRCRDGQLYHLVLTRTGRAQPDCRHS